MPDAASVGRVPRPPRRAVRKRREAPAVPGTVDTRFLQSLVGYNARRAALSVIDAFVPRMAAFGLRPVDFSILSVIRHNPGITSRQICEALNLLQPNLVGKIAAFHARAWVERRPHPQDRRALGLHLAPAGEVLMAAAERAAADLESGLAGALSAAERQTLIRLLQNVYQP